MKKVINAVAQTVTFSFDGLAPVILDTAKVTPANREYAMLHGFAARIGDNAAITKSAENGYRVTEAMRREAVLELVEHYQSASVEWNTRSSASRRETFNPHIQAIAEKRNCSYGEAMAWFSAKLQAEMDADMADVTPKVLQSAGE
jgi:hypothetical protein